MRQQNLEVREIVVCAVLRIVHACVQEALAVCLKCSLEIVTEKPANRDYGVWYFQVACFK